MVAFKNGDMYHEVEVIISEEEIMDEINVDKFVSFVGSETILESIDKDEIIEYLSKNGYQIAEEQ